MSLLLLSSLWLSRRGVVVAVVVVVSMDFGENERRNALCKFRDKIILLVPFRQKINTTTMKLLAIGLYFRDDR